MGLPQGEKPKFEILTILKILKLSLYGDHKNIIFQLLALVVANVTSTVFESKDEPTQMTKQSFTIIYFITCKKTIHFKLICKNVHSCRQYFSKHMDTVQ